MDKLKAAIVGSGNIARMSHIPAYQNIENVEIVGIAGTNLKSAKSMADEFHIPAYYDNYLDMLKEYKPDIVSVCVPNKLHCQITLDALHAGCHVLCEKPPAFCQGA